MDFMENASFLWVVESKFNQFRASPTSFSVPNSLSVREAGSLLLLFCGPTQAMLGLGNQQF